MQENNTEKTPIVTSKSFMAVGPTLHYSHQNVQICWFLAVIAFALSCAFWSKVLTGSFWSFDFHSLTSLESWNLGRLVVSGVSIFEYPWQIFVLGLLMAVIAFAPVLISQLMSLSYCLIFIMLIAFLANLPGLAVCVLISSVAVACRPLRFRSRFISVVLCTTPQLFYWGYFACVSGTDPLKWGFSFTPWICAWLVGLALTGFVLGIGHFTRYRPGLVWVVTAAVLTTAIFVFELKIGFDELDYQLYVARNNPEQVTEFHDHSITDALDRTIQNENVKKYLAGFYYPTEPIALRAELKREIQIQLGFDRWPGWLILPDQFNYQKKRDWLFQQYDRFITERSKSRRMPIALYYKALLSEYTPDIKELGQKEILHFYSDYPYESSRQIWYRLYIQFANSPESLEARWRVAKHLAGQGRFLEAENLLTEAQNSLADTLEALQNQLPTTDTIFSPFRPPADSAMTAFKLTELQRRINQLKNLIGSQNRTDKQDSADRLAKFVMLNCNSKEFTWRLEELLNQMNEQDPLRDNILLAQIKLIPDTQLRAQKLNELHDKYKDKDGAIHALYELARLKIGKYQNETDVQQKQKFLLDARQTLSGYISLYPESIFTEQAKETLEGLPSVD